MIREELLLLLRDIGIPISEDNFLDYDDIDSLQFIIMIISIEKKFSVTIPDNYLLIERLTKIDTIVSIINECKNPQ